MSVKYVDKKILILHHFEEEWESSIQKIASIDLEEYTDRIVDFIENTGVDHVIITRFEELGMGREHHQLIDYLSANGISFQFEIVPYGCVEASFSERDLINTIPSRKTSGEDNPRIKEVIYIDDWMRELSASKKIMLAGAFENECICDAEDILDHVMGEKGYQRIEGLIIGSGVEYSYSNQRKYRYRDEYDMSM